jgi:VanZ family protein
VAVRIRAFLSLWLPVILYMAAIFYASSLSVLPSGVGVIPDTVLHGAVYAGLALVSLRAVASGRWAGVTGATLAMAWAIATGYGATDEWHQMHVPGRSAEMRDLANDALGAAVAIGLAGAWRIARRVAIVP